MAARQLLRRGRSRPRSAHRSAARLLSGAPRDRGRSANLVAADLSARDARLGSRRLRPHGGGDPGRSDVSGIGPLTIGELWAIPAMLRLSLIETLRRLADEILTTLEHARQAREAGEAIRAGQRPALDWESLRTPSRWPWHELHDVEHGPTTDHVNAWSARRLADFPEIRNREFCRQAANQVSIGNAITSLRLLAVIDWPVLFEATSLVEARLRTDPGGVYARQDFGTRDRCRRAVERLARGSHASEIEVADQALTAARRQAGDPVRGHVVWFLLGDGVRDLKRAATLHTPWRDLVRTSIERSPSLFYFGLLGLLFASLMALGLAYAGLGMSVGLLVLLALALSAPASESAISLCNFVLSRLDAAAHSCRRLDYRGPLPPECGPSSSSRRCSSRSARARPRPSLERLEEQHSLANPDSRLRRALLTRFRRARRYTGDEARRRGVRRRLARRRRKTGSNESYRIKRTGSSSFIAGGSSIRRRDAGWAGSGSAASSTSSASSPAERPSTSYAVEVGRCGRADDDPVRPHARHRHCRCRARLTARTMLATFAHPLNRPRLSEDKRRVVAGYGVLQPPRVSFLYQTGFESQWFAQPLRRPPQDRPLLGGRLRHVHGSLRPRHLHGGRAFTTSTRSRRRRGRRFPRTTS